MEVVVTEEKKKIFRARKTMKISDRQQLESLHSTLLTAAPGLSEASPPPLMNGTHKEDGQKVGDKEQNNVSDSNSPRATSPASPASLSSPAPFLSLNLSPSPPSSQSPNGKEDASPSSPFHSLNFELKKMEDDEEEEEEKKEEKKFTLSSSSNESVTPASTESKENPEEVKEVKQETETKEAEQTKKDSAVDLEKNSVKGLVPCSSVPSPVSDFTEPMDTDNDTVKAKEPEASTAKTKDEKPPSPKSTTSDSSLPHPSSSSHPASSSCADVKQEKETKEEVKEEEDDKEDVKKGSISEAKMEVDSLKVQTKKEKTEVRQTTKPSRPASTPPSNTAQEDKGSTSGLKRTLSEGYEKDERPIKREVKRPKVEREELEAQLELKITAKAGSHHKLEKIVQQLVDERLRALQLTIFDKHFEELKERVDKIDCATKHQTAINTLQAKIARLAKKFGEANQASENKRKQEALAAAAAAAAATAAATAAKTTAVSNNPQVPRNMKRRFTCSDAMAMILESEDAGELQDSSSSLSDTNSSNSDPDFVAPSSSSPVPSSTESEMETEDPGSGWMGRNGQKWLPTNAETTHFIQPARGVTPGPTHYAITRVHNVCSSFRLFLTDEMVDIIVAMTNLHGHRTNRAWNEVDATDILAYIGLLTLAGVYKSRGEDVHSLWDERKGRALFRATMSIRRFREINSALRFDDGLLRPARHRDDRLAPIRAIWDLWTQRLPLLYNPGANVTVDEQLVSFKGRCRFRQYMPKKPAKYGIKVWITADADTSYAWKCDIYTGKTSDVAEVGQGKRVVMQMTEGLQGVTVICNNFFTSVPLAKELLEQKVALVGTIRKNKAELPPNLVQQRGRATFSSVFAFTNNITAVSYVPRRGKNVILISTKHQEAVVTEGEKKKPEIITYYNQHKGGVDNLDKVIGTYSCRRKTNRWPQMVFFNMLDISAYNAYVIFTAVDPSWNQRKSFRRRLFLEELGNTLISAAVERRSLHLQIHI